AYMINHNFELVWINDQAKSELFGITQLPANSEDRNIFSLMASAGFMADESDTIDLHLGLAKGRITTDGFGVLCQALPLKDMINLEQRFADVDCLQERPVAETQVQLKRQ